MTALRQHPCQRACNQKRQQGRQTKNKYKQDFGCAGAQQRTGFHASVALPLTDGKEQEQAQQVSACGPEGIFRQGDLQAGSGNMGSNCTTVSGQRNESQRC